MCRRCETHWPHVALPSGPTPTSCAIVHISPCILINYECSVHFWRGIDIHEQNKITSYCKYIHRGEQPQSSLVWIQQANVRMDSTRRSWILYLHSVIQLLVKKGSPPMVRSCACLNDLRVQPLDLPELKPHSTNTTNTHAPHHKKEAGGD